jgi:hypothetical protein
LVEQPLIFAFLPHPRYFFIGFWNNGNRMAEGLLASSAVDCFTYHLASGDGAGNTDWLLSTLFATSHPIASVTGCFKSPLFTNLQDGYF